MQIKNRFDKETLRKILKGALIAVVGAFLTYIAEAFSQMDFGELTPLVVALSSILVNAVREWREGK